MSSDPADPEFSFSFAGTAFFVVGLHPASSRLSRRFAWPTLVFNAHAQFERLREQNRFERLRETVRARDYKLEGSLNPNLSNFGDSSEARQYSGRILLTRVTTSGHKTRGKKMKSRLTTLSLMTAAAVMCIGMCMSTAAQDGMSAGSGSGQEMSRSMKVSSADQKFMMMAASGGMAEVEMGRLALEKSSSDAVKQYAQKMIDDHTAANNELKQVASMKGVTLPAQPDAKHMALMAKMQKLSGMEFDMMYVKESGVKAHESMEKLMMKESMSGKDADAKAFAAKTLPTVRMHLQMAREMMTNMKGSMTGMSH